MLFRSALFFFCYHLQCNILCDAVAQNGVIFEASCAVANCYVHVHCAGIIEYNRFKAILILDGIRERRAFCTNLNCNLFACKVFIALDFFVISRNTHYNAAVKIRLGEIKFFFSFVCNAHACDNAVSLTSLQRLYCRIEAKRLQFILKALIFRDRCQQVDVDTNIFAGFVLEFERCKCCVCRNDVG